MSDELPEGWTAAALEQLGGPDRPAVKAGPFGSALKKEFYVRSGYRVYGQEQVIANDFGIGDYFIDEGRYKKLRSCEVRSGDVLVSLVGTFGRASVVPVGTAPGIINPRLIRLSLDERLADPWFIKHYLASSCVQHHFEEVAHGGTMGVLNASKLAPLVIPLPPLAEQRRIVAKVEALLARLNAARERLEKVLLLLKRFRQSVLAKAFRGELLPTEAELAAREGRAFESASQFLVKKPADNVSDELPEGWVAARLDEIVKNLDGRRRPVKSSDRAKRAGQYPYYGASGAIDTIDDYLFDGTYLLVAEDGANLLSRSTPIAFPASGRFWVNNHAHVLGATERVELRYLQHFLNSFDLQFVVTGTAQPKLTQAALNGITVPFPPLAEQRRIVAKIEVLLAFANSLEHAVERVRAALARSPQAILQRAFAGELVPTEAELAVAEGREFESAEELLRRLSATLKAEISAKSGEMPTTRRGRSRKAAAAGPM